MSLFQITSVKHWEKFDGTLEDAITRARQINDEYQPAWGTQIETDDGQIVWDSDLET